MLLLRRPPESQSRQPWCWKEEWSGVAPWHRGHVTTGPTHYSTKATSKPLRFRCPFPTTSSSSSARPISTTSESLTVQRLTFLPFHLPAQCICWPAACALAHNPRTNHPPHQPASLFPVSLSLSNASLSASCPGFAVIMRQWAPSIGLLAYLAAVVAGNEVKLVRALSGPWIQPC